MTIKEAYATMWEKLPGANIIKIDVDIVAKRNKLSGEVEPPVVEYRLRVYADTGADTNPFYTFTGHLAEGVTEMIRKIRGHDFVPADLDAIHQQMSEL